MSELEINLVSQTYVFWTKLTLQVVPQPFSWVLRRICKDYSISMHFKPTNTIPQALVHPTDKQPMSHQSRLVYGVQCADNYNCTDFYIGETSQPLCKRLQQHNSGPSVSVVFDLLKTSGHKMDLDELKIIDPVVWTQSKMSHLDVSCGGVRNKLSHDWDRTIRTLPCKLTLLLTSDNITSRKSPESRSTTSEPSWRVVVPLTKSVCSEKNPLSLVDKIYF